MMITKNTLVYIYVTLSLSVVLSLSACSSDSGATDPPPFDVDGELSRGWSLFQSSEYDDAIGIFTTVLSNSKDSPEAYLGIGWCYAFLSQLDSAYNYLGLANSFGLDTPDADMGLAAVYRDLPDYLHAIEYSTAVLTADSAYSFSKRSTIDYKDAHLIKAVCYFRMGSSRFQDAHEEIDFLCNLLGLSLLPEYGSVTDDEYEKQIAQKLESISEIIGD